MLGKSPNIHPFKKSLGFQSVSKIVTNKSFRWTFFFSRKLRICWDETFFGNFNKKHMVETKQGATPWEMRFEKMFPMEKSWFVNPLSSQNSSILKPEILKPWSEKCDWNVKTRHWQRRFRTWKILKSVLSPHFWAYLPFIVSEIGQKKALSYTTPGQPNITPNMSETELGVNTFVFFLKRLVLLNSPT